VEEEEVLIALENLNYRKLAIKNVSIVEDWVFLIFKDLVKNVKEKEELIHLKHQNYPSWEVPRAKNVLVVDSINKS